MKAKNIYVGINGAALALSSGYGVAALPPKKGSKTWYVLTNSGKLVSFNKSRVNGYGIPAFLKLNNFDLAPAGADYVEKLADLVDRAEGEDLVSEASIAMCTELQKKFSGQPCTYVPFDPTKPVREVVVESNCMSTSARFDLVGAFNSGMVKTVYAPGSGYMDVSLTDGWLVGPGGDATDLPRKTASDELIEHAVYAMCSFGMGTLVGAKNLVWPEDPAPDALYTRGSLEVELANGDRLVVGGTSDDMLATQYLRNGVVLYSRVAHITAPKLGPVIGDIAAVLVRVAEMDAAPVKKASKKAA